MSTTDHEQPEKLVHAVKNEQGPRTMVMVLSGEYDLASREQVRAAFDAVLEAPRVALDFSDVTYIDSTIINELMRLHNVRAAGDLERETLVVRNPNLLRLFDILDLGSVLRIVDNLDDAVGKNGEHISVHYASSFDRSAPL